MYILLAALVGVGLGLVAHDFAVQVLKEQLLRPFQGTCPNCGFARGWHVLRCPRCERTVSREILLLLATALGAVGFWFALDATWSLIPYGLFLILTAALTVTDIDAMRIVDRLNLRGSATAVLLLGATAWFDGRLSDYWRGLAGGGIYFAGALLLFLLVRGNGFGAGDVKLAPVLGVFTAYLGWSILGRAVVGTAFIGGLLAVGVLVFSEAKRDTELPYGPAMVGGAWLAIISVAISAI